MLMLPANLTHHQTIERPSFTQASIFVAANIRTELHFEYSSTHDTLGAQVKIPT